MDNAEEARRLREQARELAERVDRLATRPMLRTPRMVGQVYAEGVFPTTAGVFYNTYPVVVQATAEGTPATFFVETGRTVMMRVIGGAPQVGDFLVGHNVDHRWEARRGGPTTSGTLVSIPGCPCYIPTTFYQHSSDPVGNNGIFQNCTYVWGPTPAALMPLAIGANTFLSTASFLDLSTGDHYRYLLSCYFGYYVITQVYETSVFGSPYRSNIRYRWIAGYPGNTCTPWRLSSGQIYPGGDSSFDLEINTTS